MSLLVLVPYFVSALAQTDALEKANTAYRSQHLAEAVPLYREYLAQHPDRADVHVFLGATLLSLNQLSPAWEQARQAIALNPSISRAYTLGGRILAAQRQWALSQEYFSKAASLEPRDRETAYFSGRAFFEANQFDQATQQFSHALALGASQSRIYRYLAFAWEALAEEGKADAAYRRSVQLPDSDGNSFLAYGQFLFKQSRLEESETMLREALRVQSSDAEVRFALARVLFHRNKYSEAAGVLAEAESSKLCRVHNLLLRIYSAQNQQSAVEKELAALTNCVQQEEYPVAPRR